jgi:cellulose synthase/poly-beta-1,6-N-acetylglucosamine synthase-like glycosyltransferase
MINIKELLPKSEKKWIIFFFLFVGLWSLVLVSTILSKVTGEQGLVDFSVDLSFATIPLLAIIIAYTMVTTFIFVAYLCVIRKAKRYQKKMYSSHTLLQMPEQRKFLNMVSTQYDSNKALCTIIIPSHNEESVIRRTVTDCFKQTYKNIEVIVVCHNCSDRTFEEANIGDSRVRVFDYKTKESGKGIALNYGVEKSRGKYLLRTALL